jgi:hypothetical protein
MDGKALTPFFFTKTEVVATVGRKRAVVDSKTMKTQGAFALVCLDVCAFDVYCWVPQQGSSADELAVELLQL